jgi:hypothetical protein
MVFGFKRRWADAWEHTKSLGTLWREIVAGLVAIPCVYVALRIESSNQSAMDQVIAIAIAVVAVVVLLPALEFAWNWALAPYRLRIEELETRGQSSTSPREQFEDMIRELMKEGNEILDAVLNPNQPAPETWAEDWFQRARHFFEENLSEVQVADWDRGGQPRQGLTGIIKASRKQLWDDVKARVEFLEDIDDELRGR